MPERMPITSIDLDMTNDCVLACTYCFRGAKQHRHLDYQTGVRAIDWLIEQSAGEKSLGVSLFGGEPLMQFELIKKLVPYGKRKAAYFGKKMRFGATTNSVLVTDEMIEFFRQHDMSFHTSIDGGCASHDKHRHFPDGRGSWKLIEPKIRKILSIWPDTTARATISNDTAAHWFEDTLALVDLGYTNLAMIPVPECDWTDEQWTALAHEARKISDWFIERYRQGNPIYVKHLDDAIGSIVKPQRRKHHCGAGRGSVLVKTDGTIYPCHRFGGDLASEEMCLGSIFTGFDEKKRDIFVNFDCNVQTKAQCEDCLAVHMCGISCIAVNWGSFKDIYKPHPNQCRMNDIYFREGMRVHYILQSEQNQRFLQKYYPQTQSGNKCNGNCNPDQKGKQGQKTQPADASSTASATARADALESGNGSQPAIREESAATVGGA